MGRKPLDLVIIEIATDHGLPKAAADVGKDVRVTVVGDSLDDGPSPTSVIHTLEDARAHKHAAHPSCIIRVASARVIWLDCTGSGGLVQGDHVEELGLEDNTVMVVSWRGDGDGARDELRRWRSIAEGCTRSVS